MGFFSNFLSTSFDDWLTGAASARAQYDVQKQAAVELPSLQKQGYIKAGLNPIYMAGHGFQPTAISATPGGGGYGEITKGLSAVGAGGLGIVGAVASAYRAKKEGELIDAQKKLMDAQTRGQDIKNTQTGTGVRDITEGYVEPITKTAKDVVTPIASAYGAGKVAQAVGKVMSNKNTVQNVGKTVNLLKGASMLGSNSAATSSLFSNILSGLGGAAAMVPKAAIGVVPLVLSLLGLKEIISPSKGGKEVMDLHYSPNPWSRMRLR